MCSVRVGLALCVCLLAFGASRAPGRKIPKYIVAGRWVSGGLFYFWRVAACPGKGPRRITWGPGLAGSGGKVLSHRLAWPYVAPNLGRSWS